eukprot:565453_1
MMKHIQRRCSSTTTDAIKNSVQVHRLGRMDFLQTFDLQKQLMTDNSDHDHLIFVEHPTVYTCGRRHYKDIDQYINTDQYNHNDDQIHAFKQQIQKIDRGGNVTFHGEGQLVVYPIFDLKRTHFKTDLHWYLRTIEDVIIDLLLNQYKLKINYNFDCYHDEQYTGVWVKNDHANDYANKQYKICAIGIGCTRWKTFHGLAFNINTELSHFNKIIPCGISESSKTVINLMDIVECDEAQNKRLTDDQEQFTVFTDNLIDQLIPLFDKHFNIKCVG